MRIQRSRTPAGENRGRDEQPSPTRRLLRTRPPREANAPRKLTIRYVIGLGAIALLAAGSTFLILSALSQREADARVVGIAARQISLSYQITEAALQVAQETGTARQEALEALERSATELRRVQVGLEVGDTGLALPGDRSVAVAERLQAARPQFVTMLDLVDAVVVAASADDDVDADLVGRLISQAALYRTAMDGAVFELESEAEQRVEDLKQSELVLLNVTLVVLMLEGLFLFRPATKRLRISWQERARRHADERKRDRGQLNFLAQFDPLTGLPNRALFRDRLDGAVARARRNGGLVTLMFLDLDHFKSVNDRFGHETGDALLKKVAERIRGSVRESDTVARLGGDEFTIVLEGGHRVDDAAGVADKILQSLAAPYRVSGRELFVTASIGLVIYPLDGDQVEELIKDADIAMYSAKDAGRNTYQFFTTELRERTSQRLHLIDGLRHALEEESQLSLAYQPKVDVITQEIDGVEALLRWQHPKLGAVSPARFIPLAEETDLIIPLGKFVLDEACAQARRWRDQGRSEFRVSVNISSRQFRNGDLVETISESLDEAGLDGRWLEVELTEGMLVEDTELARRTLERLKSLGITVSIDDFGTGYSSLSYLRRFPLDVLKIDQSFIEGLTENPEDEAIARAIINLARGLDLKVIAEGVEHRDQFLLLRELGCDAVQGYLVSRPVPAEELDGFVVDLDEEEAGPSAVKVREQELEAR